MFRELFNLLTPHDAYEGIHEAFVEALRSATTVFEDAHRAAWAGDISDATGKRIYDTDVTVNQRERAIRKMIVRHLSVQQGLDVIFCLRIMSLVKDVERIGDYGKNLFEIGGMRQDEFDDVPMRDELRTYGDEVCAFLRDAIEVFDASDEDRAEDAVVVGRRLLDRGEVFVERAAAHSGSPNTAVCFALMARHYKRSAGHSTNVLTGLTMPLHKLDYFDEVHQRRARPEKQNGA